MSKGSVLLTVRHLPISAKYDGTQPLHCYPVPEYMKSAAAIIENNPIVLSVTVLPPVFGPVMTSVSYSPPSIMSFATTFSLSISG